MIGYHESPALSIDPNTVSPSLEIPSHIERDNVWNAATSAITELPQHRDHPTGNNRRGMWTHPEKLQVSPNIAINPKGSYCCGMQRHP
uniref:Uncharacterized protein n=1 Tax=Anopheles funestus TaxID=62324 RepID=A0A4Y0BE68_ANOFN